MARATPTNSLAVAGAVLVALAVGGCSGAEESTVTNTAVDFYAALGDRDGAAACGLLAPATRSELEQSSGKPCAAAILEEKLPPPGGRGGTSVFEHAGQVRYDDESVFLGEFGDGWRVTAAGCTDRGSRPYDCLLAGG